MNEKFTSERTASIASSETSETLSNDESGTQIPRTMKSIKKQKEVEKVKPPWRASSTPPKSVDKNALLKARLMEASRRAIRARQICTVASQTEPHVKLMKEISIGTQKDLFSMHDKECLTDGVITVKDNLGNLILTHSVSQMTDDVKKLESGTQTLLPQSNVSFDKYLNSSEKFSSANFDAIKRNESCLLKQIDEINKIDDKLKHLSYDLLNNMEDNQENIQKENDDYDTDSINLSDPEGKETTTPNVVNYKLRTPTKATWRNIDFSDDDDELPGLPRRFLTEGKAPWHDFKDLIIGDRISKMRLSPIQPRKPRSNLKHVTWSDTEQRAISDLVSEANALIEIFDKVSMIIGPDIGHLKLNDISHIDSIKLPAFTLDPILTKSCDLLEQRLKSLRTVDLKEVDLLSAELLNYVRNEN